MVKVLFFASLKEQLGCDAIELSLLKAPCSISELKAQLINDYPNWQTHFNNKSLLAAVNQDMANSETPVNTGDEVAFFPPVTGG